MRPGSAGCVSIFLRGSKGVSEARTPGKNGISLLHFAAVQGNYAAIVSLLERARLLEVWIAFARREVGLRGCCERRIVTTIFSLTKGIARKI